MDSIPLVELLSFLLTKDTPQEITQICHNFSLTI